MSNTAITQTRKWARVKRKIYVCAPLGEDWDDDIENAAKYYEFTLQSECVPVGPHAYATMFGVNEASEIKRLRQAGMSLIWFCDEIWVFGEQITESMQEEISFGRNMKIRMRKIRDKDIKKVLGG